LTRVFERVERNGSRIRAFSQLPSDGGAREPQPSSGKLAAPIGRPRTPRGCLEPLGFLVKLFALGYRLVDRGQPFPCGRLSSPNPLKNALALSPELSWIDIPHDGSRIRLRHFLYVVMPVVDPRSAHVVSRCNIKSLDKLRQCKARQTRRRGPWRPDEENEKGASSASRAVLPLFIRFSLPEEPRKP